MNEYERMLAYLIIAYHNVWILHHHLVDDPGWFGNHKELGKWYDKLAEHYDDLTEIGISLGYHEPSIAEAVLAYQGAVLPVVDRKLQPTMAAAKSCMDELIAYMTAAEKIVPPDVQNKLQEHEYNWRKIADYMVQHAIGGNKTVEDDD